MASAWQASFKGAMLSAYLTGKNLKFALIDTADYTYSAAHVYLSEVAAASIVATSGNLTSVTYTGGVLDASDAVLSAVTGDGVEAGYLYIDTGTAATSELIAYVDGLTYTPSGADVVVQWHASGIGAL